MEPKLFQEIQIAIISVLNPMFKQFLQCIYGLAFVLVGISHFTDPELFEPLVPTIIGWSLFWVYLSGVFEVVLGVGLWFSKTRKMSSIGLVALLLVLYTANLNMWVNNIPFNGTQMSLSGHTVRAGIQIGLICLAMWFGDWRPFRSVE